MGAATGAGWGRAATISGLGGEAGHLVPKVDLMEHSAAAFSIRRTSFLVKPLLGTALIPDKFHELCAILVSWLPSKFHKGMLRATG